MIDFAQLHPVWAGVIWMSEASIVAVSIGAMIGAVVNSKEGGDAFRPGPAPCGLSQQAVSGKAASPYRGEQG